MQIKAFILQAEQKGDSEAKAEAVRPMGLHELGVWTPPERPSSDGWKRGRLL